MQDLLFLYAAIAEQLTAWHTCQSLDQCTAHLGLGHLVSAMVTECHP
jgi:hypothetical protein